MTEWYATPGKIAEGNPTIHSDPDCCALSFADGLVEVTRGDHSDDQVCAACKRRKQGTPQCAGLYERLDEMAASEVSADD